MKKFYEKPLGRWVWAALLSALFFLLCYLTHPVLFETNDDPGNIAFLSGGFTGTPNESVFLNILLSKAFMFLYGVFPGVFWYEFFILLLMFVSNAAIFTCIAKVSYEKKLSFIWPLVMQTLYFLVVCLYYIFNLQFTVASGLAAAAAVGLLLCAGGDDKKAGVVLESLLAFLLFFAAFCLRRSVAVCGGCFLVLAAAYKTLSVLGDGGLLPKRKKLMLGSLSACLALIAVSAAFAYLANKNHYDAPRWKTYTAYNVARAHYIDYPQSYEKNKETYEAQNWSEDLFVLTQNWFFMDRRFNQEALENIVASQDETKDIWDIPKYAADNFITLVIRTSAMVVFALCVFLLAAYLSDKKRKRAENRLDFWLAAGAVGSHLLLNGYLLVVQRIPMRASRAIFAMTLLVLTVCAIKTFRREMLKEKLYRGLAVFGAVLLAWSATHYIRAAYSPEELIYKTRINENRDNIERFAQDNPDKIFIYEITLSADSRTFAKNKNSKNLFFWGGTNMYSPGYYQKLEANGLAELYAEDFARKPVFFMTVERPDNVLNDRFFSYLKKEYATETYLDAQIGGNISVYGFKPVFE